MSNGCQDVMPVVPPPVQRCLEVMSAPGREEEGKPWQSIEYKLNHERWVENRPLGSTQEKEHGVLRLDDTVFLCIQRVTLSQNGLHSDVSRVLVLAQCSARCSTVPRFISLGSR